MTDDMVGRRFTVIKPSKWFPVDFAVRERDHAGFIRLEADGDTYLVGEDRFDEAFGAVFIETPPPGETGRELTGPETTAAMRSLFERQDGL